MIYGIYALVFVVTATLGAFAGVILDPSPPQPLEENLGAQPEFTTFQGGTGTSSPSGILYGDGTIRLKTVAIGSNLTFAAGTLSASGGGGGWPFTPGNYAGVAVQSTTTPLWLKSGLPSLIATSTFATYASTTQLSVSGAVDFDTLTSALILTGAGGDLAEYAGAGCTNQVVEDISALGASTCVSIESEQLGDDDLGELTVASGVVTIDDDVLGAEHFADQDWGDITIAAGVASVEDNSHAHDSTTISGLGTADISGLDISDDTNLAATAPIRLVGDTLSFTGLATTSQPASSNLLVSNGAAGVYGVATTSITCTGFLTCTGFSAFGAASSITTAGQLAVASGGTNASAIGSHQILTFDGTRIVASSTPVAASFTATSTSLTSLLPLLTVSTVLTIPSGTGPSADDPGELAHDTSDNMLILDDFVVGRATQRIWGGTFASTSPAFIGALNLPVPDQLDGYTMTRISCHVVTATSKAIVITDGTNATESITCDEDGATDDGSIANAAVTAGEDMYIDFGSSSGSPDYVTIEVFGQWTRE